MLTHSLCKDPRKRCLLWRHRSKAGSSCFSSQIPSVVTSYKRCMEITVGVCSSWGSSRMCQLLKGEYEGCLRKWSFQSIHKKFLKRGNPQHMPATGKSDSSVLSLTSHDRAPPSFFSPKGDCAFLRIWIWQKENPLHNTPRWNIKSCIESVRELSCLGRQTWALSSWQWGHGITLAVCWVEPMMPLLESLKPHTFFLSRGIFIMELTWDWQP